MIVYRAKELDIDGTARAHPWAVANYDQSCRYVNFRNAPHEIETSLEDFRRWEGQHHATVQRFYDLLRWLNGPDSHFETNDCAFTLALNTDPLRPYKVQVSGRLMLFASAMGLTCAPGFIDWLIDAFGFYLSRVESLEAGAVGISKAGCFYKAVGREAHELVLYFWAWGDSDEAAMEKLGGVFDRMKAASIQVNVDVAESLTASAVSDTQG